MIRVAIIGAGSVEFTRNVVADLCSFPELAGQITIVLHDINAERLAYSERAAASIVRRTGAGYRVEASAERRPAVDGANYVINEIQVGGYRHTLMDFEIPKKYGVRQTIGDTIGIGGIFRGLRTIPVALGIGNDLHELAPDALLLNYTNPMAMVPWATRCGTPMPSWPPPLACPRRTSPSAPRVSTISVSCCGSATVAPARICTRGSGR
jgi:alpha-galactosidase